MNKRESKFITELRDSFEKHPGTWFYKIPDAPQNSRFSIPRPFDIMLTLEDLPPIAIEAKALPKFAAINYNLLEDEQKVELEKFEQFGKTSWVFVNIRQARDVYEDVEYMNRMYIFRFKDLKEKGSYHKKELDDIPYIVGRNGLFDVAPFLERIKKWRSIRL